jgi:hypothetical protein
MGTPWAVKEAFQRFVMDCVLAWPSCSALGKSEDWPGHRALTYGGLRSRQAFAHYLGAVKISLVNLSKGLRSRQAFAQRLAVKRAFQCSSWSAFSLGLRAVPWGGLEIQPGLRKYGTLNGLARPSRVSSGRSEIPPCLCAAPSGSQKNLSSALCSRQALVQRLETAKGLARPSCLNSRRYEVLLGLCKRPWGSQG